MTEDEREHLTERCQKLVTRQSEKISLDPFNIDVTEKLTEDDICEL